VHARSQGAYFGFGWWLPLTAWKPGTKSYALLLAACLLGIQPLFMRPRTHDSLLQSHIACVEKDCILFIMLQDSRHLIVNTRQPRETFPLLLLPQ